jgi:hypothetical protein
MTKTDTELVDERPKLKHPIQPLGLDARGTPRFKTNAIVEHLLDHGPFDLNQLAVMGFNREDWEQFAQLTGYSLGGFGELSYVSDRVYETADKEFDIRKKQNKDGKSIMGYYTRDRLNILMLAIGAILIGIGQPWYITIGIFTVGFSLLSAIK